MHCFLHFTHNVLQTIYCLRTLFSTYLVYIQLTVALSEWHFCTTITYIRSHSVLLTACLSLYRLWLNKFNTMWKPYNVCAVHIVIPSGLYSQDIQRGSMAYTVHTAHSGGMMSLMTKYSKLPNQCTETFQGWMKGNVVRRYKHRLSSIVYQKERRPVAAV